MSESCAALVQARGLRKSFGDIDAVKGIDVDVARGEVFGFLGPNGAGKSSTMRMIACVSPRTGGTLRVLGMDPGADGPRIRARIGVVPQFDNLDLELTVRQNLEIYGRYFGLPRAQVRARAAELLEFAQLTDRADKPVEPLSGGMRRRLTIARSLVNTPELLLLDEPTTGLDPQARHLVWERLYRLKREGVTQIITTHYMDEAEQLCDRLVVMDAGVIVAEGSPAELIERWSTREVLELRFSPDDPAPDHAVLQALLERAPASVSGGPTNGTVERAPASVSGGPTNGTVERAPASVSGGPTNGTVERAPASVPGGPTNGTVERAPASVPGGPTLDTVERVEVLPDRVLLYTADGEHAQAQVYLAGLRPLSALVRRSSLEDVFLRLTGRTLVD